MAFKLVVLCATLAFANAGYLGAPAAYVPGPTLAAAPAAIGVAYSAAPAVSQVHYSSPLVSYGTPLTHATAPAITSQSSNILRSFGNLGQVSTYSKTIDTPFSSVQKSDVRVSNPGLRIAAAGPIVHAAAAPVFHAAHAIAAPAHVGVTYSAAPAVSHFAYTGSYGVNYGW